MLMFMFEVKHGLTTDKDVSVDGFNLFRTDRLKSVEVLQYM